MKPSEHDLDATDRMIQVGRILDIHVIDHLIISEREFCGYYSFENYGVMEKLRKSVKYIHSLEVKQHFQKKLENIQEALKKTIKETKKDSKEQGKKLGIKEGKKIGKEEGSKERNMEIARIMVEEGESIEKIIRFTGLSESEIKWIS